MAEKRFAVVRDNGEEVGCAIDFCAAVVHGGRTIVLLCILKCGFCGIRSIMPYYWDIYQRKPRTTKTNDQLSDQATE